jgi:hypothetical protein
MSDWKPFATAVVVALASTTPEAEPERFSIAPAYAAASAAA